MGDTTSNAASGPWPKSSGPSSGYIRQKNSSAHTAEEYGLRSDIGKNRGVTTVIGGAESDIESGMGQGRWNNSVSKLTEVSSDEERDDGKQRQEAWRGIRTTTVSTQIADAS